MSNQSQLSGQALADAVVTRYREEIRAVSGAKGDEGQLYAVVVGSGWIELHGYGLPAREDMQAERPNGWTLFAVHRTGYWREYLCKGDNSHG